MPKSDPKAPKGKNIVEKTKTETKDKVDEKVETNNNEDSGLGKRKEGAPAANIDSKRLYVYNFPFSITKEELRVVFEKYGKVVECIIPTDTAGKSKGYGYVSYEDDNDTIKAISELDNTIVFGRILHMKPSEQSRSEISLTLGIQFKVEPEKKPEKKEEASSFKKLKKEEFIKNLNDDTSWNSLFLNPNTVMEYVASEYGLTKQDLMSREVDNPSVKISLAETKIINETKEYLKENGINISIFETSRKSIQRSRDTVIIKNLPKDTNKNKLTELFNRYGFVNKLILPTNRSICIAQFRNIDHAANVFSKLSGYMYQGVPLYLEYAPVNLFVEEKVEGMVEENGKEDVEQHKNILLEDVQNEDVKNRTVYIKNLNFNTTEDQVDRFLKDNGFSSFKYVKIIFKNDRSCGYGFIEFNQVEEAEKALRVLNMKILDGHKLELSISRGPHTDNATKRKERLELNPSNKIIVRNIDFAASKKELRELVSAFGEVRAVRMPSKVTGEHRGYSFVEFSNMDEAKNAYDALIHTHFYGRKLVIEYAKE